MRPLTRVNPPTTLSPPLPTTTTRASGHIPRPAQSCSVLQPLFDKAKVAELSVKYGGTTTQGKLVQGHSDDEEGSEDGWGLTGEGPDGARKKGPAKDKKGAAKGAGKGKKGGEQLVQWLSPRATNRVVCVYSCEAYRAAAMDVECGRRIVCDRVAAMMPQAPPCPPAPSCPHFCCPHGCPLSLWYPCPFPRPAGKDDGDNEIPEDEVPEDIFAGEEDELRPEAPLEVGTIPTHGCLHSQQPACTSWGRGGLCCQ
jgi:hypothetical protein